MTARRRAVKSGKVVSFRMDEDEEDFPLGDGTADDSAEVVCPYCGEAVEIALDPGGGPVQAYVEDCHVCCRPWRVRATWDRDGAATVTVDADDEADDPDE